MPNAQNIRGAESTPLDNVPYLTEFPDIVTKHHEEQAKQVTEIEKKQAGGTPKDDAYTAYEVAIYENVFVATPHKRKSAIDETCINLYDDESLKLSIKPPTPHRGIVIGFSRRSRTRFMRWFASLRKFSRGIIFLTLTYPDEAYFLDNSYLIDEETGELMTVQDSPDIKRHLDNFMKRLRRKFPACFGAWRMEIKPRKSGENIGKLAPHYHILFKPNDSVQKMNEVEFEAFQTWIKSAWKEIIGYDGDKPLQVDVKAINSGKKVISYVSKYMAKATNELIESYYQVRGEAFGRHWGKFGEINALPYSIRHLTEQEIVQVKRDIVKWLKSKGSKQYARMVARMPTGITLSVLGLGATVNDLIPKYPPPIERLINHYQSLEFTEL